MNGRIYDPTLGRFLQADPFIQAPKNSQSYNRYSYVLNNPLSYTDPSGYFFSGLRSKIKKYWKVAVAIAATYFTAGAASGWAIGWGMGTAATATTAASLSLTGAITAGAIAGAAGGFVGGALMSGSLKGAIRGAFTGAIAGAAGGYANFGDVSGFADAAKRVGVAALGGCASGKASGGSCGKGARLAAYAQIVALSVKHMSKTTDDLKMKSCGKGGSICNYNDKGELLTDGGRGQLQIEGTSPGDGNWLTEGGMATEGSGQHLYSENGLVGRYVNRISKTHDYFNSNISKVFGFQGYDQATGLWLSGTETYNTLYQVYSFAGMLPAGVLTTGAMLAPYPIYQYDLIGKNQ
jgi:hypothetical protein